MGADQQAGGGRAGRGKAGGGGREPLRIQELSRRTQVTVRNIREYQDRGLLPPPERDGRIAFYGEEHVVRLRLISRLLTRGYTLAVIKDLLEAWAGGRDLHDVLGLETVVSRPWGDDERIDLTRAELDALFGGRLSEQNVRQLISTGVLTPRGRSAQGSPAQGSPEGFRCSRHRVIETIPVLVAAGIPVDTALDTLARVRRSMDAVADDMVGLVVGALLPEGTPQGLPEGADVALLTASVDRLREVADVVAGSMFGLAMTEAVDRAVQLTTGRALSAPRQGPSTTGSPAAR